MLAATAALGRTSSQLSVSTRTSTPVAWVNFLVLAMKDSISPWTNCFQRNTRIFAPFSGVNFTSARAGAIRPAAAPTIAAPAPSLKTSRLVNFDIAFLPILLPAPAICRRTRTIGPGSRLDCADPAPFAGAPRLALS